MKHLILSMAAAFAVSFSSAPAATIETRTAPAGDGALTDSTGDGIVDRAMSLKADGEDREVHSGKIWRQNRKAVFEFELPELAAPVGKATLQLWLNGNNGCPPDKEGASGPDTDLYFYLAPEADGKIELTDDNGTKLGRALEAKPVRTAGKPLPAVRIDVTEAVREAAKAKSRWIGFRLEAAPDAPAGSAWRWRTSEFAAISGRRYNPLLTIEIE